MVTMKRADTERVGVFSSVYAAQNRIKGCFQLYDAVTNVLKNESRVGIGRWAVLKSFGSIEEDYWPRIKCLLG